MEFAVVLCSGGLNSAVAAAVAAQDYRLALLHIRTGHRTAHREAECYSALLEHFRPDERMTIEMPLFGVIGGNARMNPEARIEPCTAPRERLAPTFIPGLTGSLVNAGYAWACKLAASRVHLGVSENLGAPGPRTAAIWPDYSREYAYYWNHLFSAGCNDRNITLETPLIDLTRADIIRLGQRLGVPFDRTWSCIASPTEACGQCTGCATRSRGFIDAGAPDPLLVAAA